MNVISQKTSDKLNLRTRKLKYPTAVRFADGALGTITSYVDLRVSLRDAPKPCSFRVKCRILPGFHGDILVGIRWLRHHNPAINWKTGMVNIFHQDIPCIAPPVLHTSILETSPVTSPESTKTTESATIPQDDPETLLKEFTSAPTPPADECEAISIDDNSEDLSTLPITSDVETSANL